MCENLATAHLMGMPRPIRIYYPGFISLVGLVVLIWTQYMEGPPSHYPKYLRFYAPPDERDTRIWRKGWPTLGDMLKGKNILQIELDEPHIWGTKPAKVDFIRREIERITFTCDSHTVLKVVMGEGAFYSDFTGLVKMLQFYGVKRYNLRDNSFYIFGNEPRYSGE